MSWFLTPDLEAEASLPEKKGNTLSRDLIDYVRYMVENHGEDYKVSGSGLAGGTTWVCWEGTLDHLGFHLLVSCLRLSGKKEGKRDFRKLTSWTDAYSWDRLTDLWFIFHSQICCFVCMVFLKNLN